MICYHSTFPKSQHLRKGTRPMFDQELPVSYYEEISQLNKAHRVSIVRHRETGKIYVKKILSVE